jgi:hypothetical protein
MYADGRLTTSPLTRSVNKYIRKQVQCIFSVMCALVLSADVSILPSTVGPVRLVEDDTFITSLLEDVGDCRSLLISLEEILQQVTIKIFIPC